MNKFKKSGNAFIAWITYWMPIILVISVFIICAMMVGNLIGKAIWIVFVADLVFFYLLWILLNMHRKRITTFKKKFLVVSILLLLLFIALATLGVTMTIDPRVIGNIFVFLIGCFTVLAFFLERNRPR